MSKVLTELIAKRQAWAEQPKARSFPYQTVMFIVLLIPAILWKAKIFALISMFL